jgi:hypothetical protein
MYIGKDGKQDKIGWKSAVEMPAEGCAGMIDADKRAEWGEKRLFGENQYIKIAPDTTKTAFFAKK